MEKLSVVILTYNEERNIQRCIDSVRSVADEILVVDSFSTDQTKAICEGEEVRFIVHKFEGYIEQKNYANGQATHNLLLSLDADEALSTELSQSVMRIKQSRTCDGYTMNRMTNYCGKWIHHSGWYPDVKMRLFDRRKGRWEGVNPHDRFELAAGTDSNHLDGDILHYSYYSVEEHKIQVNNFANIAAKALYDRGVHSGILKMIYKPVARFLKTYVIRLGFLDGKAGWTIARYTALSSYLRYRNLHELHNGKK
jgi:glycosyltransferase involved in cell wall biosynthesis